MPSPAAGGPTSHASKSDTRPHFAVRCPCGVMAAVPLDASRIDEDPAAILRSLPDKDRHEIVEFTWNHAMHGDAVPCVVDIQPAEKPHDA